MVGIFPKLTGNTGIDPYNISSDPNSVKDYMEDPLINYKKATLGIGKCMMDHYKEVKSKIHRIQIPVLLQKGEDDPMMIGTEELFDDLKIKDKQYIIYEGAKHEVYQEIKEIRDRVFSDLLKWIEDHI